LYQFLRKNRFLDLLPVLLFLGGYENNDAGISFRSWDVGLFLSKKKICFAFWNKFGAEEMVIFLLLAWVFFLIIARKVVISIVKSPMEKISKFFAVGEIFEVNYTKIRTKDVCWVDCYLPSVRLVSIWIKLVLAKMSLFRANESAF